MLVHIRYITNIKNAVVAKMEHLTDLKIFTFFTSKTCFHFLMFMKHADVLFLSTFNFNIWYVYLLQQLQQHISLAQCQYIFRELQLMLSNASCNSSQRLSFECTIDLAGLFSNSPQICSMGLRSGHPITSQCSSRFLPSQVVLAIVRFTGIQQIQLKPLKICQEF